MDKKVPLASVRKLDHLISGLISGLKVTQDRRRMGLDRNGAALVEPRDCGVCQPKFALPEPKGVCASCRAFLRGLR
jgi:hypothetical protein